MKKKTINSILCKKFDEFLASIEDQDVKKAISESSIITGGCIASMLLKEKVNDFDIYFTNKATVKKVAEYYVNKFNKEHDTDGYVMDGAEVADKEYNGGGGVALNMTTDRIKIIFQSAGVAGDFPDEEKEPIEDLIDDMKGEEIEVNEPDAKPKYRPVFLSANAITLSGKVQIIIRFYGDPNEIHQHYDYIHCTNFWTSKERKLVLKQEALEALLAKELVYVGSKYPICSIVRTRKFLKRGWTINAGQYLKMCFQVSKLDLTDLNVLEDQLTGVDVAYFMQLVDALKTHTQKEKEKGNDFKVEYGYLATIIDKIF